MPRKYTIRSKEEKFAIVKAVLAGTPAQQTALLPMLFTISTFLVLSAS